MARNRGAVAGLSVIRAIVWLVYALASAAIIVLAFAFVLLMFNANPNNSFAVLITQWAQSFARPFVGLIQPTPLGNGGLVAWSLLVAIAAYAVAAWVVGLLLGALSRSLWKARHEAAPATSEQGMPLPGPAPSIAAPTSQSSSAVQPSPVNVTFNQAVPANAVAPDSAEPGSNPTDAPIDGSDAGGPQAPPAENVTNEPGNESVTVESERKEGSLVGPTPG